MKALLVGSTGLTGPAIAHGQRVRGYLALIVHRGTHGAADFERVHANPPIAEPGRETLRERAVDLVAVTYGQLRRLIDDLAARIERMIIDFWFAGLADPFDYAAEDAYRNALGDSAAACAALNFRSRPNHHAYDRPSPRSTCLQAPNSSSEREAHRGAAS